MHSKPLKEPKGSSIGRRQPRVHRPGLLLFDACAFLWSEQALIGQRNKKLPAGRNAAFAAAAAFGLRQRARNL